MPIMHATFRSETIIDKHSTESLYRSIDFGPALADGEVCAGTPTVTAEDGSGLTISNVELVGNKVQFLMVGGTVRPKFWLITASVSVVGASQNQTYAGQVKVRVPA